MRSFFGLVKREPRTFIQIAEGVLVVLANDHVAIFHEVVEECANNRFHRRVRPGDNESSRLCTAVTLTFVEGK